MPHDLAPNDGFLWNVTVAEADPKLETLVPPHDKKHTLVCKKSKNFPQSAVDQKGQSRAAGH
jgi:hypothetical protein